MSIDITMPRLSDTMESGTVIKWNVKEGDKVAAGDVLADIETDKATMELQAYDAGTVAKIVVGEGESVGVGSKIMVLAEEGEDAAKAAAASSESAGAAREAKGSSESKGAEQRQAANAGQAEQAAENGSGQSTTAVAERSSGSSSKAGAAAASSDDAHDDADDDHAANGHGRVFASPLARKIAEEEGLDLAGVRGSGPSGRIVRKDVEAAIRGEGGAPQAPAGRKAGQEAPPAGAKPQRPAHGPAPAVMAGGPKLQRQTVPLSNIRRTIAKRLVEAKATIPHYQVTVSVNMDPLLSLREQLNTQLEPQGVKLSVNDFLVRACALAMHQHPFVNSKWIDRGDKVEIEILGEVNVGVAIALPIERGGGLVVATLRNADRMGLRQISAETRALAEKARARGLTVEEMADATFTISNLGMFGVEHFTAIINPPNSAILAVGAAIEKAVVRNGQIIVGHEMAMTMSSDHRVIDGAMAAMYLNTVKQFLESPATLLV